MNEPIIHQTAIVDSRAKIGSGSRLWVNVQVREGAAIGAGCVIGKDVYIDQDVTIGDSCKIQNSVSIYQGVTLEDEVFIGPNACFTNDKVPRAFSENWTVVPTKVRHGASIGANATIICGVEIGEFAMVAAGSVVTKSVESYALVAGNPARPVGYVDRMGNRVERKP